MSIMSVFLAMFVFQLLPYLFGTFHEATAGKAFAKEAIQRMVQMWTHIGQTVILISVALREYFFIGNI